MGQIARRQITIGNQELAYLAAGDNGPLAICIHGFPDTAHTWRHLAPVLSDAGYRVVAPWLRGYAPSGLSPEGCYQNGAAVADVLGLWEALDGDEQAVLVGHDWGARIATGAAVAAPDRFAKLVTAAVPPAGAVAQGFLRFDQLQRSWYMFFFQSPLADLVVGANDLDFIDRLWADWSPGYDATDDLVEVKAALTDPANLAAALGTYRATLSAVGLRPEFADHEAAVAGTPTQPHLYLHGDQDGCMGVEVARLAEPELASPGSRMVLVEGAGHFLHLERPELVNQTILEFLASP